MSSFRRRIPTPPPQVGKSPFPASVVNTHARNEIEFGRGVTKPDPDSEIAGVIEVMAPSGRLSATARIKLILLRCGPPVRARGHLPAVYRPPLYSGRGFSPGVRYSCLISDRGLGLIGLKLCLETAGIYLHRQWKVLIDTLSGPRTACRNGFTAVCSTCDNGRREPGFLPCPGILPVFSSSQILLPQPLTDNSWHELPKKSDRFSRVLEDKW